MQVIVLHVPGLVAPSLNCLRFNIWDAFEKLIEIRCVETDFPEFLFWCACVRIGTVEHARRVVTLHMLAEEKNLVYIYLKVFHK